MKKTITKERNRIVCFIGIVIFKGKATLHFFLMERKRPILKPRKTEHPKKAKALGENSLPKSRFFQAGDSL